MGANRLVEITSRITQMGQWCGKHDVKRGDVLVCTEDEARRYVGLGYADFGRVKSENLGEAYAEDPDLLREARIAAAAAVPEESRPLPQQVIGSRYSRGKVEGWIR